MKETEEVEIEHNYEIPDPGRGYGNQRKPYPEMYVEKVTGWNIFSEEVSWFIYDFFKYGLNGYEKLLFYSYYINGMTLVELAAASNCSFQYMGVQIKIIEKKLGYRWRHKDTWKVPHDRD